MQKIIAHKRRQKKNENKTETQRSELPAVMASLRFRCALSSGWKSNKAANIASEEDKQKKKELSKIITTTAKQKLKIL